MAERLFNFLNKLTVGPGRGEPGVMHSSDDLKARARIRDAALLRFGRDGFAGTPVRRIAADAKVSAALVVHHYGSKQGLIEACDAHAMAAAREAEDNGPTLSYLARAMVERPAETAEMFDEMVAVTERTLAERGARPVDDPRLRAVVLVCMELGGFALHNQLGRHLGVDPFGPDGLERLGVVIAEVLMGGLFEGGTA
ncbi:TetR/AcrR family transcriptional regulator [Kutzneria chonburiensis]|uniref:TetR/AcrR family transcriptional regulator n=1 Tax=Kutzneria chonburiensis TaxID=1483604 RepID=A0ABV6N5V3_9PSEU